MTYEPIHSAQAQVLESRKNIFIICWLPF